MNEPDFEQALNAMLESDGRYHRDAYLFVREGLEYTQKHLAKDEHGKVRHVSGQELLGGLRGHAIEQFGPLALLVLEEWGVRRCEDFGEIVFNMIEYRLLARTEKDSRADFTGGYDFEDAFRKPFLPEEPASPARRVGRRGNRPAKGASRRRSQSPKQNKKDG
ncbi:MAG: Minf_1886 family protein [Verrucomicrobiota bacterium]|nr:Minf_1886 family protein [Verrucomicrobiota bacterium]